MMNAWMDVCWPTTHAAYQQRHAALDFVQHKSYDIERVLPTDDRAQAATYRNERDPMRGEKGVHLRQHGRPQRLHLALHVPHIARHIDIHAAEGLATADAALRRAGKEPLHPVVALLLVRRHPPQRDPSHTCLARCHAVPVPPLPLGWRPFPDCVARSARAPRQSMVSALGGGVGRGRREVCDCLEEGDMGSLLAAPRVL